MIVLGLMSGTSVDGVDAAIVEIEGEPPRLSVRLRHFTTIPFSPEQRRAIFRLFSPETSRVDVICAMNFRLGAWFADAALQAIAQAGLTPDQIDLVGSHGQTIHHLVGEDAPTPSTLQIGEAAVIAERTGVTTVADFRVADVAAGGQGAPLVSYVDWLLLRHPHLNRAAQNIGGIGNVTWLPAESSSAPPISFDTGPGNMLIDAAVAHVTRGAQRYDEDGRIAARGRVHEKLLAELLAHPYLHQRPPKTAGREQFGAEFTASLWPRAQALGLSGPDLVATLTAFTAESIVRAYRDFLPAFPDEIILSGGGALNPTLTAMLRQRAAPARVRRSDELGLPTDAKEAIAFAVLAYETIHRRPGNLPACTGARHPVILGKITPASPGGRGERHYDRFNL